MANYYATARSNYFKVKDADAFKAWCLRSSLEVLEGKENLSRQQNLWVDCGSGSRPSV